LTLPIVFRMIRWSVAAIAALFGLAMFLYPGGTFFNRSAPRYSFFQNSLSDLGSRIAWGGQENSLSAMFSVAGSIILVLAGVACLVTLVRVCSSSRTMGWLARLAGTVGMLSCGALIGASLAPEDRNSVLHGQFTILGVASFPVTTALCAWVMARSGRFRRRAPIGLLVLTLLLIVWIAAMAWHPTTGAELMIPVTLQKIVMIGLLGNLLLQSYEAERAVAGVTAERSNTRLQPTSRADAAP